MCCMNTPSSTTSICFSRSFYFASPPPPPGRRDSNHMRRTPANAPARCAMWFTPPTAAMLPLLTICIFTSDMICFTTNWPRMKLSMMVHSFSPRLSFTSTLTANRPKTAPDAPRETVWATALPPKRPSPGTAEWPGSNRYDARLAPTPVTRYVSHTPAVPSSSSTSFPKMYRKKMLLDRCSHPAWQNVLVTNWNHLAWSWYRYKPFMNGRCST
mmetsp:Transcript_23874/g.52152  ORF Transcript_23874/g.52152 Transcript_23874/m.52152 type:complete len:213 (-) Transcript_23874:420-1058(-)